jgi:uncharacterized protein YijF (DUF1287 family)
MKPLLSLLFCLVPLHLAVAQAAPADPAAALVTAALERTKQSVRYDASYQSIAYPMGDVPDTIGVCSDVVIRSYRALGIDLQRLIHEDMKQSFEAYPNHWGLTHTDRNIDHRRVPNIRRFLERRGAELQVTADPKDYKPGDLVTWNLGAKRLFYRRHVPHIGIVSDQTNSSGRPLIVHNIGRGPRLEDMLFRYTITGHYRFLPEQS